MKYQSFFNVSSQVTGYKKNIQKRLFLYLTLVLASAITIAQKNSGIPNITITDMLGNESVKVDCDYPSDENRCFDLKATYAAINESTSYSTTPINYKNPVSGLTHDAIVEVSGDDLWSTVQNIPFEFCFFDNSYTKFSLGDNGIISFDIPEAGSDCQFIRSKLPSGNLPSNAIFGVFHDMLNVTKEGCFNDPATLINECGEIKLYTVGKKPQRQFIISYEGMNHFACEDIKSTSQIVLYETSNIIEVYVKEKPVNCEVVNPNDDPDVVIGIKNRKNALIGIQNKQKNTAYFPENRNNTEWSTTNEAWQFRPNGTSVTTVKWRDEKGVYIAEGDSITICPEQPTTYTAEVTYDVCIGEPIVIDDTINIDIDIEFPVATDVVEAVCDIDPFEEEYVNLTSYEPKIIGNQTGLVVSYHRSSNDAKNNTNPIANTTNFMVTGTGSTVYVRLQRGISCFDIGTLKLKLTKEGVSAIDEIALCDNDNDNAEVLTLADYDAQILGGQSNINISYHVTQDDADNNINPITELTASNGDRVFIRLTIGDSKGCPNVIELPIRLKAKPIIQDIPIALCDHILVYDLTQHENEILSLNTNANLTFTYYTRKDWAEKGINSIEDLKTPEKETENYILNKIPVVFVRAESAEGCFEIFELQFTYKKGIPVNDTDQTQVDTVFDLTESIEEMIKNSDDSIKVKFFVCKSDPIKVIKDPENYNINGSEETICVKFINEEGCENTGEIDLTSIGGGGSGGGGPLGACDTDNDGQETFILSEFDDSIKQNVTFDYPELLVFKYFKTQQEANDNVNPIEEITITQNKTLYVRISVVSKGKELKFWVEDIELQFKETYAFKSIEDEICDLKYNNFEKVDLTQYEDDILEGTGLTGSFTYYQGENKIDNPEDYTLYNPNPEKEITVIVTTPNGCGNETTITLRFEPKIVTKNTKLEACDYDTNGEENFNLNDALPEISANYADFTISFYTQQQDAETGDVTLAIKNPDNFNSATASQKLYVRIQADSGCYTIAVLDIFVREAPEYKTTEIELCDFENNAFEGNVDLTQFNTTIIGSNNTNITYYATKDDADNGTNAITTLDINKNTIVYTKLVSDAVCENQSPITFKFIETPIVTDVSIDVCDNLGDNLEEYNLLQLDANIVTGSLDAKTISYHKSLTGAQNNNDKVQTPAFYKITTAPQTLFARIQDDITSCYSTAKIDIKFIMPTTVQDVSMKTCDEFGDGSEFFDVTSVLPKIIPDAQKFKVSYYSKLEGAINQDDTLSIDNPSNVDSAINSTVYVRFDKESTGCFSIAKVFLELLKTPKLLPGKFRFCDVDLDGDYITNLTELNSVVIQNTTNLEFSYYLSFKDANSGTNPIANYENYLVPDFPHRVYLRVTGTNGCHSVSFVDLSKKEQVSVNPVTEPLQACDDDLDGYAIFDLTSFESKFTSETGATFKYYNSNEDAKADQNAITNSTNYTNGTPLEQDIFVRVHVHGKCDTITQFTLQTLAIYADVTDVTFCDGDTATLDAGKGYANYLWSTGETTQTITVTQPGAYSVTLSNAFGCSNTFKVNAIKVTIPEVNNVEKVVCDDAIADARVAFNLNTIIPEVTNNDPTVNVTFYKMEKDAENEINAIKNPENFTNIINPQKVFIKVYEQSNRCYSYATFTIRVSSSISNPAKLEVCDELESEDGIATFNLKDADAQVLNGVPSTKVSYFETKEDAYANINRLPLEYTNTKPYQQVIYSRVINDDECASYGTVTLIVRELPKVTNSEALYCLNSYPDTITLYGIENDNRKNYTYNWSTGATTPTIEVNTIGTYTVKVTNAYGCTKSRSITVKGANIATIDNIEIADKSKIDAITIQASGISEYDYSLDGIIYQDSNIFENIEPGVYTVHVREKIGDCGVVTEVIAVLGFPDFFTPNGDGYNDTWLPIGYSPDIHTNMEIHIFDRYGKLLHEIDLQYKNGWDGAYNGKVMPGTDYWYKASYTESFSGKLREFFGHFTLRR